MSPPPDWDHDQLEKLIVRVEQSDLAGDDVRLLTRLLRLTHSLAGTAPEAVEDREVGGVVPRHLEIGGASPASSRPGELGAAATTDPPASHAFDLLFEAIPIPTLLYDIESLAILAVNRAAVEQYGFGRSELEALTLADIRPAEDLAYLHERIGRLEVGRDTRLRGHRHRRKDGSTFRVETTARAFLYHGRPAELVLVRDITERLRAEHERESLIEELRDAIAHIKTLRGMLPICASCKKIRDDTGYWTQIEEYVSDHADVEFTHGLCPACIEKLYPELADPDAES